MNKAVAKSNRRTLLLLLLVFLAPALGSWLLYMNVGRLHLGTTNHGEFVDPPKQLDAAGLDLPKDYLANHRWTLVYLGGAACAADCERALNVMHLTQLALGEKVDAAQRLYLVDGPAPDPATLKDGAGLAVANVSHDAAMLGAFGGSAAASQYIYLVDPRGFLMMRYPLAGDPKWLLQDFRHLLGGGEG